MNWNSDGFEMMIPFIAIVLIEMKIRHSNKVLF